MIDMGKQKLKEIVEKCTECKSKDLIYDHVTGYRCLSCGAKFARAKLYDPNTKQYI